MSRWTQRLTIFVMLVFASTALLGSGKSMPPKEPQPIPLIFDYELLFVDVHLNGKGPYRFLLDTGSQGTYVTDKLIKALDLIPGESRQVTIETNHSQQAQPKQEYSLQSLQMGDHVFNKISVSQIAALNDIAGVLKTLDCDGLLGMSVFHDAILTLDIPQKRLFLEPSTRELDPNVKEIAFAKAGILPIIPATVIQNQQSRQVALLIDTGFTGSMKMPFCLEKGKMTHQPTQVTDIFKQTDPSGIGTFEGEIKIGELKLDNPTVLYPLEQCDKQRDWGLIGTQFLSNHAVRINFMAQNVVLLS